MSSIRIRPATGVVASVPLTRSGNVRAQTFVTPGAVAGAAAVAAPFALAAAPLALPLEVARRSAKKASTQRVYCSAEQTAGYQEWRRQRRQAMKEKFFGPSQPTAPAQSTMVPCGYGYVPAAR